MGNGVFYDGKNKKPNRAIYKSWRRKKISALKKLHRIKQSATVWEKLKRGSKKI
jgi:hypothetical protein